MLIKRDTSTVHCSENKTMHDRLRLERERLQLSQATVCSRLLVSRGTYIKYESGETYPTAFHLSILNELGFDIYFIVVGERSANELGAEMKNLIDAYNAASDDIKSAAFAVLMSGYINDISACKVVPNYVQTAILAADKNAKSD